MASRMTTERDQLAERVGSAVRAKRKVRGLSQEALAAEIGISVVTLSNIERGENVPTLSVFFRLHRALRLDADELAEAPVETLDLSGDRQQLESKALALIHAIDLRDLKLLLTLAAAMRAQ